MKKRLHTMSAGGMTLGEVGTCASWVWKGTCPRQLIFASTDRKLESSTVQGFPIVSSDSQRALLGYIGRTELRYVLGQLSPFS